MAGQRFSQSYHRLGFRCPLFLSLRHSVEAARQASYAPPPAHFLLSVLPHCCSTPGGFFLPVIFNPRFSPRFLTPPPLLSSSFVFFVSLRVLFGSSRDGVKAAFPVQPPGLLARQEIPARYSCLSDTLPPPSGCSDADPHDFRWERTLETQNFPRF